MIDDPASKESFDKTDDRLLDELTCAQCGYDLRGLSLAGNCPECGCDIAAGLASSYLRNNDPIWLGRLETGAQLAVADFALMGATFLAFLASQGAPGIWNLMYKLSDSLPLLDLLTCWITTSPSKTLPESQQRPVLRRAIRVAAILTFAIKSLAFPLYARNLAVFTNLLGSATLIAFLFYVRHLAQFLRNRFVQQQSPLLMAAWALLALATLTLQKINAFQSLDVRVQLYFLAWIFVQVYACTMFVSLTRSLRVAAVHARNHWRRFSSGAAEIAPPADSATF